MASKMCRAILLASVAAGSLLHSTGARAQVITEQGPITTSILQAMGRLMTSVRIAVVQTGQRVADASNTTNADFAISLREMGITRDHVITPATCAAVDGAQALAVAGMESQVVSSGMVGFLDPRGEGQPGSNGYYGVGQSAQSGTADHYRYYCSALDEANGICQRVNGTWQSRDQRAVSLFGVPTYSPDDAAAAQAYWTNLIQPMVPAAPRVSAATSLVGMQLVAERRQYNSRISLSNFVGSEIAASHAQTVAELGPDLQRQMQIDGRPASAKGSWFDAMDLEIRRRYSLSYQRMLQRMGSTAVISREQVQQQSLTNTILWAMYRRLDQIAALNAAILSDRALSRYEAAQRADNPMPSPQITSGQ